MILSLPVVSQLMYVYSQPYAKLIVAVALVVYDEDAFSGPSAATTTIIRNYFFPNAPLTIHDFAFIRANQVVLQNR